MCSILCQSLCNVTHWAFNLSQPVVKKKKKSQKLGTSVSVSFRGSTRCSTTSRVGTRSDWLNVTTCWRTTTAWRGWPPSCRRTTSCYRWDKCSICPGRSSVIFFPLSFKAPDTGSHFSAALRLRVTGDRPDVRHRGHVWAGCEGLSQVQPAQSGRGHLRPSEPGEKRSGKIHSATVSATAALAPLPHPSSLWVRLRSAVWRPLPNCAGKKISHSLFFSYLLKLNNRDFLHDGMGSCSCGIM